MTAHLLIDDGDDEALPGTVYRRGHCACGQWSIGIAPPVGADDLWTEFQRHVFETGRRS